MQKPSSGMKTNSVWPTEGSQEFLGLQWGHESAEKPDELSRDFCDNEEATDGDPITDTGGHYGDQPLEEKESA